MRSLHWHYSLVVVVLNLCVLSVTLALPVKICAGKYFLKLAWLRSCLDTVLFDRRLNQTQYRKPASYGSFCCEEITLLLMCSHPTA